MKWLAAVIFCVVAAPLPAWQEKVMRLYVEPFATKDGSEKLREDLIVELRKSRSISIVADQSHAEEILGGGGEIWVKGYRRLSPMLGNAQSNGAPVYGGFLSIELRDAKGETLWSDLVTPDAHSKDVSADLAKRIAKHLAEVSRVGVPSPRLAPGTQPSTILKGAGATFPFPVYSKWFTNYRRENPNVEMTYQSIGSEAGVRKLLAGEVDFGASDSPEVITDLAAGQESRYLLFPSVIGAVVPIVNLPGVTGQIRFTPEALAGIYLGTIKKWNDPVLVKTNRLMRLPDLDIIVVHRADGSGTSYAWTDYLSKTSPAWKAKVGAGLAPNWPIGEAASGNDGVAKLVKQFGGAIGYVEFIYALDNRLTFGQVRNRHGEFVEASLESIALAASGEIRDDLNMSLVNAKAEGAYPIASLTWLVLPTHIENDIKRTAMAGFVRWMLGPGQSQAAALGYLGLPKDLVNKEVQMLDRIK